MSTSNERIVVFQDTIDWIENDPTLSASIPVAKKNTTIFYEDDYPQYDSFKTKDTVVTVSMDRSYQAAIKIHKENPNARIAVMNFANAFHAGGGVTKGSSAQEECLCRCSGLYFSLNVPEMWNSFYAPHRAEHNPHHNDDIIYTPDVTVFKTDTDRPELMPEEDWYDVDVISCAAPNLRQRPSNTYNSGDGNRAVRISDRDLQSLHEKRLRRILDVAVMEGADCIILGAFGCGAFMNSPRCVATAAARVVPEYLFAFRNIEFAVYCRPDDDTNYRVFRSMLGRFVKNGPQT
jgi:uncharacterized protein (TIGR02452 family)